MFCPLFKKLRSLRLFSCVLQFSFLQSAFYSISSSCMHVVWGKGQVHFLTYGYPIVPASFVDTIILFSISQPIWPTDSSSGLSPAPLICISVQYHVVLITTTTWSWVSKSNIIRLVTLFFFKMVYTHLLILVLLLKIWLFWYLAKLIQLCKV